MFVTLMRPHVHIARRNHSKKIKNPFKIHCFDTNKQKTNKRQTKQTYKRTTIKKTQKKPHSNNKNKQRITTAKTDSLDAIPLEEAVNYFAFILDGHEYIKDKN